MPAMSLHLDVSRIEDIALVRCRGRIVFGEESDELRALLLRLLTETKKIVLNLAWIAHIDSSGLGTLVSSFISARHHEAEIKLAALSPMARQVLTGTHIDQLFEVYESTEEAIASFQDQPRAATG
jgi:anti-sigma B factor antagonist